MFLDNATIDAECPKCGFYNAFTIKQVRLRDVIICRGCKVNIHLEDHRNECRASVRRMKQAYKSLQDSLSKLNMTFRM